MHSSNCVTGGVRLQLAGVWPHVVLLMCFSMLARRGLARQQRSLWPCSTLVTAVCACLLGAAAASWALSVYMSSSKEQQGVCEAIVDLLAVCVPCLQVMCLLCDPGCVALVCGCKEALMVQMNKQVRQVPCGSSAYRGTHVASGGAVHRDCCHESSQRTTTKGLSWNDSWQRSLFTDLEQEGLAAMRLHLGPSSGDFHTWATVRVPEASRYGRGPLRLGWPHRALSAPRLHALTGR
jgi:hypothetical protein